MGRRVRPCVPAWVCVGRCPFFQIFMAGVYVHIPFCRRKCYYCDFFSVGSRMAPWHDYARAVVSEAEARCGEWSGMRESRCAAGPDTLYIGGGTPSQMPVAELAWLVEGVCGALPGFSPSEVTVEVNPEDVTMELASVLRGCGVNRVSMGVQTLSASELKAIGRNHDPETALRAYDVLRGVFGNISLDLIFGLPSQDIDSWRESVEGVLALRPEHLSAYSLMWEERTALSCLRSSGRVEECDEDVSEEMFRMLTGMLGMAGYEHYEISNYCMPGYRSVHNSSYWTGEPYLGLGPGAHSYDGERTRRANRADIKGYVGAFGDGGCAHVSFCTEERLSDEELREEYVMTRLRRREGIDVADYSRRFGSVAGGRLVACALEHPSLLCVGEGSVRLSADAVLRSDSAILALL